MKGVISLGDEEILVSPSPPTASQLINSKAISKDHINNWSPNKMESAQATAGVEEIILLDPPLSNFEIERVRCFQKPNCSSQCLLFALIQLILILSVIFSNFFLLSSFHFLVI